MQAPGRGIHPDPYRRVIPDESNTSVHPTEEPSDSESRDTVPIKTLHNSESPTKGLPTERQEDP